MVEKCKNHKERKAISYCHNCGKYFCEECLNEGNQYYYCNNTECYEQYKKEKDTQLLDSAKIPSSSNRIPFYILAIIIVSFVSAIISTNFNNVRDIYDPIFYILGTSLLYIMISIVHAFFVKLFTWNSPLSRLFKHTLFFLLVLSFLIIGSSIYADVKTEPDNLYNYTKPKQGISNSFGKNSESTYSIDGYFKAYFPSKPHKVDDVDTDVSFNRSYMYFDEENSISYHGTYNILRSPILSQKNKKIALNGYFEKQIGTLNGTKISSRDTVLANESGIVFSFIYKYENFGILKHNAVILTDKAFYSWAIQEVIVDTKPNTRDIFYKNLDKFVPIK